MKFIIKTLEQNSGLSLARIEHYLNLAKINYRVIGDCIQSDIDLDQFFDDM